MRGSIPLLTGATENLCIADAGCSDLLFGRGCRGVGLPTLLGPPSKVIPSGALVSILDVGHLPKHLIIFLSNYSLVYLPEPDAFDVCLITWTFTLSTGHRHHRHTCYLSHTSYPLSPD